MIKATELRIGNKIKVSDDIVDVTDVCDDGTIGTTAYFDGQMGCCDCTDEMANGIPLTSKIIKRCGFVECEGMSGGHWRFWRLENGWSVAECLKDEKSVGGKKGVFYWGDNNIPIIHLHRLQNIYYALTGEELTIKETV